MSRYPLPTMVLLGALITGATPAWGDEGGAGTRPPTHPAAPAAAHSGTSDVPGGWLSAIQNGIRRAEYEVTWQSRTVLTDVESAWHAPNRAHDLRTYFTANGIRVVRRTEAAPAWEWGLHLQRAGRGERLAPVAPAELVTAGNRVEYRHGDLVEWYVNDERGLEQGFTVARDPGGDGELVVELAIRGNLTPGLIEDAKAVEFLTASGVRVLRYADLRATDAAGRMLPTRMALDGCDGAGRDRCALRLVVDAGEAAYPVTVDPLTTSPAWVAESNQAGAYFGVSVASAGDVNGDGYADVIIGSHFYDNGEADEGRVFVYHGAAAGLAVSAAWTADGNLLSAHFGQSVASAGDVNGDGFADVIVGAPNFDNGQAGEGRAFVYHGSAAGLAMNPAWTAESDQAYAMFGYSVASAGDLNGDGFADVIVGATTYQNGQIGEGRAFVYNGSAAGLATNPSWTAEGDQAGAYFAYSVASAGDVNGDGFADVIVGAPYYDNGQVDEGRAFVFYGSASGLSTSAAWTAESDQASASFGYSVASAGDVNGDGYSDVIVGAPDFDGGQTDEGRAFVFLASASGLAVSSAWTAEGGQDLANFAYSVASAGDVNGDGIADVIVGARYYRNGQMDEGSAYVYHGSASGLATSPAWAMESNKAGACFGRSVASAGDVNGDGYADVIIGAFAYENGESSEGRAFVYLGSASGVSTTEAWTAESDQASALLGASVASAGDVNGDGYADVIVGARLYSNGQINEGRVFVYHGSASGLSTNPAWTMESNKVGAYFGCSVASAGDVNGDGYADVIIGAFAYDNGEYYEGRAFVYQGSASGLSSTPAWTAESNQADTDFGSSVASAGDVNGDGFADVIVGANYYENGETNEGAAFVYHGSPSGLAATPAWTVESNQALAYFGSTVASAGDVNGDGFADVIVGAFWFDNDQTDEGRVFVYYGSTAGLATTPAWTAESGQTGSWFGESVSSAGDVNGDGFSDIIVGAKYYENGQTDEGRAFAYYGSASGLPASPDWTAESNTDNASFGISVASAGDVDGDGFADVVVGAQYYTNDQSYEGRAVVYHGSATGLAQNAEVTVEADQSQAQFGQSVASAGDINGDGFADVVVGAPNYDNGSTNEGRAFTYLGGGGAGRLVRSQQLRGGGSGTAVHPWGWAVDADDFQVRANAQSPFGRSTARIEIEACPTGVAFGSGSCTRASSAAADTGASATGVQITGSIGSLSNGTLYRWRSRTWWQLNGVWQHGPWHRLSGQATEADIRVAADLDGDGVPPPLDCDETDDSVYYGAPELCDLKDNDCDDQVDEPVFAGLATANALGGSECGIRLDWSATSACSGSPLYNVYRSTTSGFTPGSGNLLAACVAQPFFIDTAVASGTPYSYVVRAENPSTGGSGPCYGGGEDANAMRRTATASACSAASGDVLYLTARAGDTAVRLEWVNPTPGYASTRLCAKVGGYPTGPSDAGATCIDVGAPGDAGSYGTTTFTPLPNGTLHFFAAYVSNGSAFSGGKYTQARPFDTTAAGKWAYFSAATALAPSGIRPNVASYAFSNDRILHAMAAGAGGGTWPVGWVPASMNAPAQARPSLVTFPSLTILGASSVAFAGAQDGRVYAFNALTGASLWASPVLGDAVQAGPSVIATDFGGVANLALVATRTPGGDSKVYGLNLADGSIAWTFDNGGGTEGIGIISTQLSAEPSSSRLWVTSRAKTGGSTSTVWCLSFTADSATKAWGRALGDVDAAAILRNDRLYVGTNAGTIHALDPTSGADLWSAPYATSDGAVKAFVWVEVTGALTRLYCSTNTKVHALDDGGSSATALWPAYSTGAPSPVLVINGNLYIGTSSSNGQILRLDALTGTLLGAVALGDPTVAKTVGAPSFDTRAGQVIAGTDQGAVYAASAPF